MSTARLSGTNFTSSPFEDDLGVWTVSSDSRLPFSEYASTVIEMIAENAIRTSSNNTIYTMPYTETEKGVIKRPKTCALVNLCKRKDSYDYTM